MQIAIFIGSLMLMSLFVVLFIKRTTLSHEFSALELAILIVAPILLGFVAFKLSVRSKEMDWEYWGSTCQKVEYQERYGKWETETYSCNCTTDKNGSTSCETCTRTVCNHYGPYYYAYNEFDTKVTITEKQYEDIVRKWGQGHKETGETTGSCPSGSLWRAEWNNDSSTYQVFVEKKRYKNKVRYNTIYNPIYSKKIIKQLNPYDYPPVNGIDQAHVIGEHVGSYKSASIADEILAQHAGTYGPKPHEERGQVKPFLFTYVDKPSTMADAQRAYLEGGNKNEFIVMVNYDSTTQQISWYDIITFSTEDGALVWGMKEWLENNKSATLDQIATKMVNQLENHWVRMHFTQLNEVLTMNIPVWIWIVGFLAYTICLVATFMFGITHE